MADCKSDAPTRIVSVDPLTGEMREEDPGRPEEDESQETKIFLNPKDTDRQRAEHAKFLPTSGKSVTDDATALWRPENPVALRKLFSNLLSKMPEQRGRPRFVVFIVAACVIVAGAGGVASSFSNSTLKPPPPLSPPNHTPQSENPISLPSAPPLTPLRPIVNGEVERPRLIQAAEALTQGRYEKALIIYRELSAWNATDDAARLAVDILERQQEEAQR